MSKKSLAGQDVERREAERTDLKTDVKLIKGEEEIVEEIENSSLTGLFIKTNTPEKLQINDTVKVSFIDENGIARNHAGQVVRKSERGFAIHYWRTTPPPPIE
ncbi:MAG: PilZ domain-containing protein [Proteobacteria bacterium]|nr:PilZ domain-containing protein [Pseudomonadota bacterium]MBU1387615.1 PilZ domain-containing protein [Pseudomonadota bacterium]MBU1544206.1 PilZ domain-containing protein [Pseudomonadota bacterium]MBU2431531.1 PilZ domain-containing protein [Pseudomonadota bacterium]